MISFTASAKSLVSKVDSALQLLSIDRVQSQNLSLEILNEAKESDDSYALVKSNYILGYINKIEGDFGKAIIYYLEGIRYAEAASYPESQKDLTNLLQNTGIIFKKFGMYELAKDYYNKAMNVAVLHEDIEKYTHLIYLSSMVLKEEKKYREATNLLESTFPNFHLISKKSIANIYNQLGLISNRSGNEENALLNFKKLLQFVDGDKSLYPRYASRAYHNIGTLYFDKDKFKAAVKNYRKSFILKQKYSNKPESIFLTSKDIGESYLRLGNYDSARHYLGIAEQYFENSKNIDSYYELYKLMGLTSKAQGKTEEYAKYQGIYATSLEKYLEEQHQIEASDKKYNLDLITQRYFALVAEQDRNQQIQYYSAVGGSFLVTLIVLIIAFFQYRKYRLRKDLEASLRPYIKNAL